MVCLQRALLACALVAAATACAGHEAVVPTPRALGTGAELDPLSVAPCDESASTTDAEPAAAPRQQIQSADVSGVDAFATTERYLATVAKDGTVRVWELATRSLLHVVATGAATGLRLGLGRAGVRRLAWSADGTKLAILASGGTALGSRGRGDELFELDVATGRVASLGTFGDPTRPAPEDRLRLWDIAAIRAGGATWLGLLEKTGVVAFDSGGRRVGEVRVDPALDCSMLVASPDHTKLACSGSSSSSGDAPKAATSLWTWSQRDLVASDVRSMRFPGSLSDVTLDAGGSILALLHADLDVERLVEIPPGASAPREATDLPADARVLTWDARNLVFRRDVDKSPRIFLRARAGGTTISLPWDLAAATFAPGDLLLGSSYERGLWAFRASTGVAVGRFGARLGSSAMTRADRLDGADVRRGRGPGGVVSVTGGARAVPDKEREEGIALGDKAASVETARLAIAKDRLVISSPDGRIVTWSLRDGSLVGRERKSIEGLVPAWGDVATSERTRTSPLFQ
jgi:hypothetical protein